MAAMGAIMQKREAPDGGTNVPAIRFSHVSKVFGGVHALEDVSFEVGAR